ncbi:ATP-binding protein [Streptomyces sp. Je 1-369]|uniref:ATP-binding protein n=1 Tax=Streptomyces sp. Je 1-369 TaxID=2966192 RepID=UPI00228642EF|nr:ATP-binding protein [Streptomyces sp. Je 1-369]WAL96090.1 ATP-binding protein [Streptomyces sp. Je 1-369]
MQQPLEKRFSRHPVSVGQARSFVAAALTGWQPEDRLDDVKVCVSELATNAIRHSSVGRGFLVRVASRDERLRVEVRDGGGDDGQAPYVKESAADVDSGRGLYLVATLADDWGVNRHEGPGRTVWAEFKASPPISREATTTKRRRSIN